MVGGIELILGDHSQQVRKLERRHAAGLEQHGEAGNEVVDVGHVGQYVVCRDQIDLPALRNQLVRQANAEEALDDLDPLRARGGRGARRRLDAIARDAGALHELQQVTVVRGDLGHQAGWPQIEARAHRIDIGLAVGQPGGRERTEICVVIGEQLFAAGVVFGLHQPAFAAHQQAQREPGLGRTQSGFGQVGVGRRSAAQVQKGQPQFRGAVPALQIFTPSNRSSIGGWFASRGEISVTAKGQLMRSLGSRGFNPPSALEV